MIRYFDIYDAKKKLTLYKEHNKEKFTHDIITFDIETTSYSETISFMYVWQININGTNYYGRYWKEFKQFIDLLNSFDCMFVIWVHNLSFEFRFLESVLKFDKVFATSPHKVLYAECGNVMFRCSYRMSGLSLEKLSENYNLKTKKMAGDLDYSLIRHSMTTLTEKEMKYIENDVQVLYEYISYMLQRCGSFSFGKMPLTCVGFTRKHLRENVKGKKQYGILRAIVKEASPIDINLYNLLRRCFAGGYTHANWIWLKQVIEYVTSLDKSSFYPSIMCKEKFPRKFRKIKKEKYLELIRKSEDYATIADVAFFNIRAKTTHSIISKHKCAYIRKKYNGNEYIYNKDKESVSHGTLKKNKPPIFDNGRVVEADCLVISITELDYLTIEKFYDFDFIKVGNAYTSHKRYLPKSFIETVLELYSNKTKLKNVDGMEVEYMLEKSNLNSLFGACVTDILRATLLYNQEERTWKNEELKGGELEEYRENYNSILLYQTGVYITAYARYELLEHNLVVGEDVIYNDTDSLKMVNYEKYKEYFEMYNDKVKLQLYKMCDYYGIDKELLNPCDVNGENHFLGYMENEGTYAKFKTLGAKRYIYELDGELHATVAGIPKKSMVKYLNGFDNPFDAFNNQLCIKSSETNKNTFYYTEPCNDIKVTDYLDSTCIQSVGTGLSIIPQSFSINLSSEFSDFMSFNFSLGISHEERLKNINKLTRSDTLWE